MSFLLALVALLALANVVLISMCLAAWDRTEDAELREEAARSALLDARLDVHRHAREAARTKRGAA
jgi:hypothetical protein